MVLKKLDIQARFSLFVYLCKVTQAAARCRFE